MTNTRYLGRFLLLSLFLLGETGCTTRSLRNLFVLNRKSDLHTVEERDSAQKKTVDSSEESSEPVKNASWNPFKRGGSDSGAADPSEKRGAIAASEKPTAGFRLPFGGEDISNEDPFLQDESARDLRESPVTQERQGDEDQNEVAPSGTPDSSERPIRRTAAGRSESIASSDSADKAIVERPFRTTVRPARSELEEQRLAELDALLEGRELAAVRETGRSAVASASKTSAALKSRSELAAKQAREAATEKKQSAELAAREIQGSLADAEGVLGEVRAAKTSSRSVVRAQERAEPLILRRPQAKRAVAGNSELDEAVEESTADESSEVLDSDTAVAAAEILFGDLQPKRKVTVREDQNSPATAARNNDREFGWKSSEPAAGHSGKVPTLARSGNQGNMGPLRLAGLQQEFVREEEKEEGEAEDSLPTIAPIEDTESTPEFDEMPASAPIQHAPTPRNRARSNAYPSADPFMEPTAAEEPANSPIISADVWDKEYDEAEREEVGHPDSGTVSAPVSVTNGDWMPPLSARTWVLAVGGLALLAMLFIPSRRRGAGPQTTVSQTSIA